MLIISDTHGNKEKIKYFLEYKAEEKHCHAGDIFDSLHASDDDIIACFNLLADSDCILLWGNHDIHYLKNSPFICTGFRDIKDHSGYGCESNVFTELITDDVKKNMFKASVISDNFIITHAGIHRDLFSQLNHINEIDIIINNEMETYLKQDLETEYISPIFNIRISRGGKDNFGGIFWADYRQEIIDKRFNQVFGHCCRTHPVIMKYNGRIHAVTDTPGFFCFNTKTKEFEDFFPESKSNKRKQMERPF